jgi:hypothetical protein
VIVEDATQPIHRDELVTVHDVCVDAIRTLTAQRNIALAGRRWKEAQAIGAQLTPLTGEGWQQQLADCVNHGLGATVADWQADYKRLFDRYIIAGKTVVRLRTVEAWADVDLAFRTLEAFRSDAVRVVGERAIESLPPSPGRHSELADLWRLQAAYNETPSLRRAVNRAAWRHLA